jgi:hypothetical protein
MPRAQSARLSRASRSSSIHDPGIENGDLRHAGQLDAVLVCVAIPVAVASILGVVRFRVTTERLLSFLRLEEDTYACPAAGTISHTTPNPFAATLSAPGTFIVQGDCSQSTTTFTVHC